MIEKPGTVNLFYSLILVAIGLTGFILSYLETGDMQFTALIPFLFGIVLLLLTRGISRQNKSISHIAVLLTLFLAVFTLIMFITNLGNGFIISRKGIIFSLIIIFSFIVLTIYVIRFIRISKS